MKVMFLFRGLPHYYNYVLNRLSQVDGLDVLNVIPTERDRLPDGVFQTDKDIEFRICQLEERPFFNGGMFFRDFWRLLLRERPDIVVTTDVHLRGLRHDPATTLIRKLFGIHVILKTIPFRLQSYGTARQRVQQHFRAERRLSPFPFLRLCATSLRRLVRLQAERQLYRFPDAHVNYVEAAYEIYGSYGVSQERIFITYNSPDTDRLLNAYRHLLREGIGEHARPHRIIHVGRLVEWKRVDLLLQSVGRLKLRFPDIELLVIGSGPMEEHWKRLAADLGLMPHVSFLGGVYDPIELGRYLMTSSVYVLAGMGGLSINEAMCFGLPIICSVCDGTERHLVREGYNGLFFRDGDVDDLCDKIATLLEDRALAANMGLRSLGIVKDEINIHTVIQGYVRAFNFVTGQCSCSVENAIEYRWSTDDTEQFP